jgi:hypothetical protein
MSQPWIPGHIWQQTPRHYADHYEIVVDEDLGAIAQLTTPDGTTIYGAADPGKHN